MNSNDWPLGWENYSLWVYDEKNKLVHLKNYPSLSAAEQAMHEENSYAGGEGRLFKLYHKPLGKYRYEMVKRIDTRRPA